MKTSDNITITLTREEVEMMLHILDIETSARCHACDPDTVRGALNLALLYEKINSQLD